MPPKRYLLVSVLCHAAVVAIWWFGVPGVPAVHLMGLGHPDDRPATRTAHVKMIKADGMERRSAAVGQKKPEQALPGTQTKSAGKPQEIAKPTTQPNPSFTSLPAKAEAPASSPPGVGGLSVTVLPTSEHDPEPIKYAGAPAEAKSQQRKVPDLGKQPAAARPSSPNPAPTLLSALIDRGEVQPSTAVLPAAEHQRPDGFRAPGFEVSLNHPEEIDRVLATGQGVLLIRCDEEQYLLKGTLGNPERVVPIAGRDLWAFSERSVMVRPKYCKQVLERLQSDYSVSASRLDGCRFHLLLSHQVDRLILARQQAAATALQCHLEDLTNTVGHFEFTSRQVSDFRISLVVTRDGRRLPLDSETLANRDAQSPGPSRAIE